MNRYKFTEEPHAHWLDEKPLLGTTTVLSIISKELTWWASGMCAGTMGWLNSKKADKNERLISAGAKLTDIKLMNVGQYLDLLDTAYKAHNVKKESRAAEGTDLHALAEEWIKNKMDGDNGEGANEELLAYVPNEKLRPFITYCERNVKRFLFSEIHCYSERLWVGGKTDFGYEDMDGNYVLADIKSRDKDYFSDHVQCGAYDILLSQNGGFDADGNKTFEMMKGTLVSGKIVQMDFDKHAIFTLGEKFKEPVFSNPQKNRDAFEFALGLYKLRQDYEG